MKLFDSSKYQSKSIKTHNIALCGKCGLHKKCNTPKMQPTGKGKKGILFIAETPSEKEDKRGIQLTGKPGQFHRKTLRKFGIDLDEDCKKTNGVICYVNKPTDAQIDCCRYNLLKEIKDFQPKLIIPLGTIAIKSLLGHRYKGSDGLGGINRWRGWNIPDRDLNCWVCPTFHPSYVTRMEGNEAVELYYKKDLKNAFKLLDKSVPQFQDEKEFVEILNEKETIKFLKNLLKNPPTIITIDYETTGLKPHIKGHKIVSCSITLHEKHAAAFLITEKIKQWLTKVLRHPKIWKIAANLKFEETWSRVILETSVKNWLWDTMLNQHILDNRSHITGLKFQTCVRYGKIDYNSHIEPFLKSDDKFGANSFNRIFKIPSKQLLLYNGEDTIFEHRLAMDQMNEMNIDPEQLIKEKTNANNF